MVIKNSTDPIAKNMTKNTAKHPLSKTFTAKNPVKNMTENTSKSYYFHGNKRSQTKNHVNITTKAHIKGSEVKICGYNEKGLLVGWGMNGSVFYSRVDNQCIAGWFKMMCENDNRVVGEILRSVEEYKLRRSKAKDITANAEPNTANAEDITANTEDITENNKENNKDNNKENEK